MVLGERRENQAILAGPQNGIVWRAFQTGGGGVRARPPPPGGGAARGVQKSEVLAQSGSKWASNPIKICFYMI